jgi:hypothetical protein
MMWPLAGLALFGLFVAGKAKPKTAVNKLAVLGPRSGETWDAELFPEAGLVVVHSRAPRTGTVAAFNKDPATKRFVFRQGKGNETLLAMMRDDFEGEKPPL